MAYESTQQARSTDGKHRQIRPSCARKPPREALEGAFDAAEASETHPLPCRGRPTTSARFSPIPPAADPLLSAKRTLTMPSPRRPERPRRLRHRSATFRLGGKPPPARPASERPARGSGRNRQGLRPLRASRQHPARLRRRLENVCLLAAPPGPAGDAARSGSGRPLPRVASRARRGGTVGRHPREAAVGHRLALPPARPAAGHPRPAYRHCAGRHPPPARAPSPAEGRRLRRRASGDAGDAGHGPERPA